MIIFRITLCIYLILGQSILIDGYLLSKNPKYQNFKNKKETLQKITEKYKIKKTVVNFIWCMCLCIPETVNNIVSCMSANENLISFGFASIIGSGIFGKRYFKR